MLRDVVPPDAVQDVRIYTVGMHEAGSYTVVRIAA